MYTSPINPKAVVIDDSNYLQHVRTFLDGEEMGRGLVPRDYEADPRNSFAKEFPFPIIPESEWKERIEEKERTKTTMRHQMEQTNIPCKNQQSTSYCWIFAATSAVEIARANQGEPFVSLSPASAGAPIKGYRNQGGWSTEGIRWIANNGLCPSSLWPDTAINRSYDNEESKAEREKFKVAEWTEFDSWPALVTCMLINVPVAVGYNWWGHAIVATRVAIDSSGEIILEIRNSWSASWGDNGFGFLKGSKKVPEDSVAPIIVTPSGGQ